MRNIKLTIEYDGTAYAGWQTQKNSKTVQQTIEDALRKLFKERIKIIGSGRTDAGVHALGQVANFSIKHAISTDNLQKALNSNLPKDIVVTSIKETGKNFHSRFDVKAKVYRYTILNRAYPSALLKDRVYFYPHKLDINLMKKMAKSLLGRHDFKRFCNSASITKDTVRTIKRIDIKRTKDGLVYIDIEADGFLYNMVRRIVGSLVNGSTAPARGLCLIEVKY